MDAPILLSVPNISERRRGATVAAVGAAFTGAGVRLLDVHSDRDHLASVLAPARLRRAPARAAARGVGWRRPAAAPARPPRPRVWTPAGAARALADALISGAREAVE